MRDMNVSHLNIFLGFFKDKLEMVMGLREPKFVWDIGSIRGAYSSKEMNSEVSRVYLSASDHQIWVCPYAFPFGEDYLPEFARTAVFSDPPKFRVSHQNSKGDWKLCRWEAEMKKAGISQGFIEAARAKVESYLAKHQESH